MQENTPLVTKARNLRTRKQEFLNMITKLENKVLMVNEQDLLAEVRVEILLNES